MIIQLNLNDLYICFFISAIPNNVLLMNLSNQLEEYDSFLIGYMGCSIEEVRSSMYVSIDYKICVLKMLSLWRCKDEQDRVKTVEELLSALKDVLQRGPYKVLESVITGKWSTYVNLAKKIK